MNLSPRIAAALDSRLDSGGLPGRLEVEEGPYRFALELSACGPVGLAFDCLEFAAATRPTWSPEELSAWGERLAARVTYLMEPLVILEHDREGGELALRSQQPTARADRRAYYEVRLGREGTLRLSRVAFDADTRQRRAVPCQMTREMVERLADDLVTTAG